MVITTRTTKRAAAPSTSGAAGGAGGSSNNKKKKTCDSKQPHVKDANTVCSEDIASFVLEFLCNVSLARFTATDKTHRALLNPEVIRRKAKFQEIEDQVKQLVGYQGEEPSFYIRCNVERALKLCRAAKILISWGRFPPPFFKAEAAKFVPPSPDGPSRSPLCILPTIFYLPKAGEPVHPDESAVASMNHRCSWMWGAEDHGFNSDFFQGIMMDVADELASDPMLMEAFRAAAREIVFFTIYAKPCMTRTLKLADEMVAETGQEHAQAS